MPPVEGCDRRCADSFSDRDDGRVDRAEAEVGIGLDQVGDPDEVGRLEGSKLSKLASSSRRRRTSTAVPPILLTMYAASPTTSCGTTIGSLVASKRATQRP